MSFGNDFICYFRATKMGAAARSWLSCQAQLKLLPQTRQPGARHDRRRRRGSPDCWLHHLRGLGGSRAWPVSPATPVWFQHPLRPATPRPAGMADGWGFIWQLLTELGPLSVHETPRLVCLAGVQAPVACRPESMEMECPCACTSTATRRQVQLRDRWPQGLSRVPEMAKPGRLGGWVRHRVELSVNRPSASPESPSGAVRCGQESSGTTNE